jgi:hypothetical protein
MGLVAIELWAMHFVELKRWQDFFNPGSVDTDPLFPQNKLPAHEARGPRGRRGRAVAPLIDPWERPNPSVPAPFAAVADRAAPALSAPPLSPRAGRLPGRHLRSLCAGGHGRAQGEGGLGERGDMGRGSAWGRGVRPMTRGRRARSGGAARADAARPPRQLKSPHSPSPPKTPHPPR